MADDDVDVTLRLKAIDDTSRVLDDVSRRTQAFLDKFNQGLKASTAATKDLTDATNKLTTTTDAVGKATKKAADETAKHAAATAAHTRATQAAAAATSKHAAAVSAQTAAISAGVTKVVEYGAAYLGIHKIIETVQEGYKKFAESQRAMERIQLDTRATNEEMQHLGETIHGLSALTGQSGSALKEGFAAFREQTDLAFHDAEKLFEVITRSAFAAGTSFEGMSRIATAALTNLKVPQEQIADMLETMGKTVPSTMMDTYAAMMPRITQDLHSVGVEGKQAAVDLGAAFSTIAISLGGNARQAAITLEDILHKATDISSPMGQQTIPMIQKYVGTPEQVQKTIEASYEVVRRSGFFNTKDLAVRSSILQDLGIDSRSTEALDALDKKMKEIYKVSKDLHLGFNEVGYRIRALEAGPQATLDKIHASSEKISGSIGKAFSATGIPKVFSDALAKAAKDAETIANKIAELAKYKTFSDTGHLPPARPFSLSQMIGAEPSYTPAEVAENEAKLKKKREDAKIDAAIDAEIKESQKKTGGTEPQTAEQAAEAAQEKLRTQWRERHPEGIPSAPAAQGPRLPPSTFGGGARQRPSSFWGIPGFATGGEFTVPGSGRGDDQPVSFMATPGERVTVQSITAAETTKGLQQQQDKADLALQEHFARFHPKLRPGAQIGSEWPHDRLGLGKLGAGGGAGGGGGGGGGTSGSGHAHTGTDGTGKDGTAPADGTTPGGLKVPTSLDPSLSTGPAETTKEAIERGYIKTEGGTGPGAQTYSGGTDRQKAAQAVANEMRAQGMPENVIAGMLANVQSESDFNPANRHEDQPGHGGEAHFSHGLFQEGGDEWNTWEADMRKRGLDPSKAWKDPKEQARFVASRLKGTVGNKQYADLYKRMTAPGVTKEQAAQMFVAGYLKPAKQHRDERVAQYGRGVPGVEHYTGPGTAAPDSSGGTPAHAVGFKVGDIAGMDGAGTGAGGQATAGDSKVVIDKKGAQTLKGVDPILIEAVKEGSKFLPEGYKMVPTSGVRGNNPSSQHFTGHAADWKIIGPDGKELANRGYGEKETELHGRVARGAYGWLLKNHPEEAKRFEWGGSFETKAGSGVPDLMHYDLGGARGRLVPKHQVRVMGPLYADPKVAAAKTAEKTAADAEADKVYQQKWKEAQERNKPAAGARQPAAPVVAAKPAAAPAAAPAHASADASPSVHAAAEAAPEGKQSGGPIEAGKPYLVGEKGPELINPQAAGNVTSNDQLQQMMSRLRSDWDRPIEPIIRPRIQQTGPLSMRWSRQSERQRSRDINRDQARAAPTDQGFA